jgi:hypothetical protein
MDKWTLGQLGKTKPKQTQFKPNSKPIQSQYEPNSNPKQTQSNHTSKSHKHTKVAVRAKALPEKQYEGPARIIVPTARTNATAGESPTLKVIILDNQKPKHADLYWRRLGGRQEYSAINLTHIARAVYSVSLPLLTEDIEYHIKAITADDKKLYFPATAPTMNQTVVVTKPD